MTAKKTSSSKPRTTARQQSDSSSDAKIGAAKSVGVDVSKGDISRARHDGAIEAEKKAAEDSYRYATDGNMAGDPDDAPRQFTGYDDIMQFEPLLGLGVEAFEATVAEEPVPPATVPIPEEKVYGLLALERNGQNRTPYVKAMMKRLGLKASELPGGGPGYTNDVQPLTLLED